MDQEQLISQGYALDLELVRTIFEAADLDPTRKRLFDESLIQSPGSYITRGNSYYQMGEYAQSVADYTRALELQPGLDEALYLRGFALAQLLKYGAAVADFTETIRLTPENPAGYFARGVAYSSMLLPQSDLAVSDLTKAIDLNPAFIDAYHARGLARAANLEFDLAIDDFTRAIQLDERFLDAYYARGTSYGVKEEFAPAIADFSTVINLNPNFGEAYRARGLSYSATNDKELAVRDLEMYLALVITAPERTEVEDLIATLRGAPSAGAATEAVSLPEAVSAAWIDVEFQGLGVASGDSILSTVQRIVERDLEITIPQGIVLISNEASEQTMVIRRVRGLAISAAELLPTDVIRLTDNEPQQYFVEAYDLDFHTDNSGPTGTFSLGGSVAPDILAVLETADKIPEARDDVVAIQAAIWVELQDVTWNDLVQKGSEPDLKFVQAILEEAGIDPKCRRLFGGEPCAPSASANLPFDTIGGLGSWDAKSWTLLAALSAALVLLMVPQGVPALIRRIELRSSALAFSGPPSASAGLPRTQPPPQPTPLFPIAATTTQARLEWQVPIRKLPFVIGSGNGADLVLKARSLSPEHAQIVQQQGRYLIRDMASAEGTFVTYPGAARQERRINENAITDGSIIRLGDFGPMVFREQQSPALLISVRISGLPWMVGADDDNDLVLKGGGVLGRHAQVDIQSGRHVLRPLGQGQTHVSFPQRERLVKDVNALREGSTIRIGEHLLTFRAGEN